MKAPDLMEHSFLSGKSTITIVNKLKNTFFDDGKYFVEKAETGIQKRPAKSLPRRWHLNRLEEDKVSYVNIWGKSSPWK